jgi:hypothetical protein
MLDLKGEEITCCAGDEKLVRSFAGAKLEKAHMHSDLAFWPAPK